MIPDPEISTALAPVVNSPSFFSLPRELRDVVYHNLWLLSPHYILMQHGRRFDISYLLDDRTPPAAYPRFLPFPPPWLLASRTILNEGLSQFYRQACCTGIWRPDCAHWLSCCSNEGEQQECTCEDKCHAILPHRLLDLSRIHHINVPQTFPIVGRITSPYVYVELKGHESGAKWIHETQIPYLAHLLRSKPNKLHSLAMHFCLPEHPISPRYSVDHFQVHVIDVSGLHTIGTGLEQVQFSIQRPHFRQFSPGEIHLTAVTFRQTQRKLVCAAKLLTTAPHGENHGWASQDWIDENTGNWHVRVKRGPVRQADEDERLEYPGLVCFTASSPSYIHDGDWYRRISEDENGVVVWGCEQSGARISIRLRIRILEEESEAEKRVG